MNYGHSAPKDKVGLDKPALAWGKCVGLLGFVCVCVCVCVEGVGRRRREPRAARYNFVKGWTSVWSQKCAMKVREGKGAGTWEGNAAAPAHRDPNTAGWSVSRHRHKHSQTQPQSGPRWIWMLWDSFGKSYRYFMCRTPSYQRPSVCKITSQYRTRLSLPKPLATIFQKKDKFPLSNLTFSAKYQNSTSSCIHAKISMCLWIMKCGFVLDS